MPAHDGDLRRTAALRSAASPSSAWTTVKPEKGYAGPVVVCAVYFLQPVAGYIPARAAIRYLAGLRDIEVWLAPIAGTRVLVPYRAQGSDPDRRGGDWRPPSS